MDYERLNTSLMKAGRAIWGTVPVLLGAILLISLADSFISKELYASLFSGNPLIDPLIGSILGSIFAGNPSTSYILGGELVDSGVSLLAVTAFLVSWVTVGVVQFPAEAILLGKRFAFSRNIAAFLFSIIVAMAVSAVVGAW